MLIALYFYAKTLLNRPNTLPRSSHYANGHVRSQQDLPVMISFKASDTNVTVHLKNGSAIARRHHNQQSIVNYRSKLNWTSPGVYPDARTLYVITPTYVRRSQKLEITRVSQTLMLIDNLHWIVIEDSKDKTAFITELVRDLPLPTTHLNIRHTAAESKLRLRGVTQRNLGLQWLLDNSVMDGVMYFADDDNAYHRRLFDEIRTTEKIGLLPTGNMMKFGVSTPVVKQGKIVNFTGPWPGGRKWQVEMASMAINIRFWRQRGMPKFTPTKTGYIETSMLENMNVTFDDLEPKAKNCSDILVWHTKAANVRADPKYLKKAGFGKSNIENLLKAIQFN